jgi:multidrug efflux pump subunit AcrB
VAEVYGPDLKTQVEIARKIKSIFEQTPGVVDVDWYYDDDQQKVTFVVDREKATRLGFTTAQIAQAMRAYLAGVEATLMHIDTAKEPVPVVVQAARPERSSIEDLKEIKLVSPTGAKVSLAELVRPVYGIESKTIYHKNLQRVVYVTADVAGKEESPIYAILKIKDKLSKIKVPGGYQLKQYYTHQPFVEDHYAMKWDGEWQITYEVFRDLGIAFAAVLVLIYILVVAWFRHFVTPLIIMAPIPLTLVGIMPGHWLFGAFFTATSMIGFIALAGIIVRNSILLIDFIQMQWRECGKLDDSVVKAGLVRFRPIVLTAAAVVVGAFVILFDPIFQGLAIVMMFGAVGSTALTLVAVPILYYEYFKNKVCPIKAEEGSPDLSDQYSEM